MKLHHFTSTHHLPSILDEGVLRTTESNGDLRLPHAKPDVVWLLDTGDLEGLSHGLAGSAADKTAVRITVDVPKARAERWLDWAKRNHVDPVWQEALIRSGGGLQAAKHWYVTERPIARRFWTDIRVRGQGHSFAGTAGLPGARGASSPLAARPNEQEHT